MTDSFGRKVNFKNCLIIMTSNIGVKKMQDFGAGIGFGKSSNVYADQELKKQMLNKELKNYFAPEFINRLDEIIVFNTLKDEDVKKIVLVEVSKLQKRLGKLGYTINLDDSVIDYITKVGFDEVYGARPLKRAIQEKIEDFVSDEVLRGNIKSGKNYTIKIEEEKVILEEEVTEKKTKVRKKKGE
jgi:ATP-dependent Clp protease ATP-binding subunit ClpC